MGFTIGILIGGAIGIICMVLVNFIYKDVEVTIQNEPPQIVYLDSKLNDKLFIFWLLDEGFISYSDKKNNTYYLFSEQWGNRKIDIDVAYNIYKLIK